MGARGGGCLVQCVGGPAHVHAGGADRTAGLDRELIPDVCPLQVKDCVAGGAGGVQRRGAVGGVQVGQISGEGCGVAGLGGHGCVRVGVICGPLVGPCVAGGGQPREGVTV